MQIMEAAISHYDLNDAKYERVKNALNSKLFDGGHFDYLYATRHGGQFIFHVSYSNCRVSNEMQFYPRKRFSITFKLQKFYLKILR